MHKFKNINDFIYLFIISLCFFVAACAAEKAVDQPLEGTTPSEVVLGQMEENIAFDVLGGLFAKRAKEIENQIVGKGKEEQENRVLYQTISEKETREKEETPFMIDVGFQFNGKGGHGKMSLSATGEGISYAEGGSEILHFSPLNLQFSFYNYTFDSACVENVKINGAIHCQIEGDYEVDENKFLGEAVCQSNPSNSQQSIIYHTPFKDYSVTFQAILKIDGNPYKYDSYTYEGEMAIDGNSEKVESLVSKSGRCFE